MYCDDNTSQLAPEHQPQALMARIDRTLAEANRTLGQNSVEHGVKKIRKRRRWWEE